ncbi:MULTISPECIES: TonB-dependent receptor domain-containing protein [unclassified Acinetobacter]|uniref:TonB-dependent receptor domain-containing protein n=1 Tax=unclassified Acinetobacter TaxID=196816 RepID=UPI0035B80801
MLYSDDVLKNAIEENLFCGRNTKKCRIEAYKNVTESLQPHKETAYSYALGTHWQINPAQQLSVTASHQERIPNAQELYAHGMHLATNSFEFGNNALTKEKSNNFEIALKHQGEKLDYKVASYLYDFDNYIYLLALNSGRTKDGSSAGRQPSENDVNAFRANRYMQSPAHFYGFEGNIGHQVNPTYHLSVFGDYVKGKLVNIPDTTGATDAYGNTSVIQHPDRYTPRLPPMRLGTRVKADFDEHYSGDMEYYHVFDQNKLSKFEAKTLGHHMLNVGLNYHGRVC